MIKWQFTEKWWGEEARFRVCGLDLMARDLDGDASQWWLGKGRHEIASSDAIYGFEPYHFNVALEQAEARLRLEVKNRIKAKRKRGST